MHARVAGHQRRFFKRRLLRWAGTDSAVQLAEQRTHDSAWCVSWWSAAAAAAVPGQSSPVALQIALARGTLRAPAPAPPAPAAALHTTCRQPQPTRGHARAQSGQGFVQPRLGPCSAPSVRDHGCSVPRHTARPPAAGKCPSPGPAAAGRELPLRRLRSTGALRRVRWLRQTQIGQRWLATLPRPRPPSRSQAPGR